MLAQVAPTCERFGEATRLIVRSDKSVLDGRVGGGTQRWDDDPDDFGGHHCLRGRKEEVGKGEREEGEERV